MAHRMSIYLRGPACPYYLKTHPFKAILKNTRFMKTTSSSRLFALRGNGIVQQTQHLRDFVILESHAVRFKRSTVIYVDLLKCVP